MTEQYLPLTKIQGDRDFESRGEVLSTASPVSEDTDWEFLSGQCDCEKCVELETRSETPKERGNGEMPNYPLLMDIFCGPADPACYFRSGDVLRIPTRGASVFWAVAGVYFDSIETVKHLCSFGIRVLPGLACKVSAFVDDAESERWLVLFVAGVFDGVQLGARQWVAEEFFHGMLDLSWPLPLEVGFVQFIPWYDYRSWRKQCDFLLDTSLCGWSLGEDLDLVESRTYRDMDRLLAVEGHGQA
ncbi:hypothetical protein HIM_12120 [Hirsutella minnesotensis 3608]|uniref:Uncharacterized protein n=1 Tax=Hirsutella minnesotensis 3608 TaxID=1043627 RepID=A0A0F7ZID7_9HYPO|nr:hypothetical protein HIM_12120 [Hirsutella minnesotensis 3608]